MTDAMGWRAMVWPIEEVELGKLDLDPGNVRVRAGRSESIAGAGAAKEAAIIRYMIEAEELLDLTGDILRDGYIDNELPVVIRAGKRYLVLEGNRRVSALKLIANPKPFSDIKTVARVVSRGSSDDVPSRIRVMLAPTRQAAQPLLARLHTGQPKKSWLREQQAIFFHAQLGEKTTVSDLRVEYPGQAQELPRFIRMGEMRALIRGLTFPDKGLRRFVLDSELKMTAFEYAYRSKKIAGVLGLEFDKDGLLTGKTLSGGQTRGLLFLLEKFRDSTLNTRSDELKASRPQHEELLE
uniref:hypothetical protein n=1 Tax=Gordonia sp. B7-2 TaxID=3420932 RepID=UPI003D9053B0